MTGQTVFLVLRNTARRATSIRRIGSGRHERDLQGRLLAADLGRRQHRPRSRMAETWLNGVPVDGKAAVYPDAAGPLAVLTSIATAP